MEEQKSKEKKQPNLMNRVLFSTFSFCVLLFFVFFVHTIIRNIPYKYLKLVESDPAKFFQYLVSFFSGYCLFGPYLLIILTMIGFLMSIAALSFTLKRRVPVFTAVLSVLIFWIIYQWLWAYALAADPDPYGAALVFFVLVPFIGAFSGVVAFVPMFFIENYLIKSKPKIIEKSFVRIN